MLVLLCNLTLFFPCFASFFWGATLLWNWKRNLRPQNIWAVFMLVLTICHFIWGILFRGIEDYRLYYKLDVVDITLTLFIFPFIHLYFHVLTQANISWKQHLWFAPGVLIGAASAIIYLWMGGERATEYIYKVVMHPDGTDLVAGSAEWLLCAVSVYFLAIVLLLQIVIGMTYSTLNLIRYKRGLSNFFSNLDEKSIKNNQAVLGGVYVLLALALLVVFIWYPYYEHYLYIRHILMAIMGVVIYYMGYHVSQLKFTTNDMPLSLVGPDDEHLNIDELNDRFAIILPAFIRLIDEDKVFLQKSLTLDNIAERLYTNRTYISRLINEQFHCTFYDFINKKRIEYVKSLVEQGEILSQKEIADRSGFASAETFSRTFKKITGTTFNSWKKEVK